MRWKTDRKVTTIAVITNLVLAIAYDLWAYLSSNDSTISIVVWLGSYLDFRSIPTLLAGFLIGHFFAPPYPRNEIKE